MRSLKKTAAVLIVTFAFTSNVQATELNILSSFFGWVTTFTTGEKPDPAATSNEDRTTGEKPDPNAG